MKWQENGNETKKQNLMAWSGTEEHRLLTDLLKEDLFHFTPETYGTPKGDWRGLINSQERWRGLKRTIFLVVWQEIRKISFLDWAN